MNQLYCSNIVSKRLLAKHDYDFFRMILGIKLDISKVVEAEGDEPSFKSIRAQQTRHFITKVK